LGGGANKSKSAIICTSVVFNNHEGKKLHGKDIHFAKLPMKKSLGESIRQKIMLIHPDCEIMVKLI
jgi:hypothetical protein